MPDASHVFGRFFLGLTDCLVPIARIMVPEILGPAKAVIGMALIPGEQSYR